MLKLMTGEDAKNMLNDIVKFLTIIIIYHLVRYIADGDVELFDENIIRIMFYATIGIIVYNMFIRKNFEIKNK